MKLKVRIAVSASLTGEWCAYGYPKGTDWDETMDAFEALEGEQRFWVEAEIEVADQPTVVEASAVKTAE